MKTTRGECWKAINALGITKTIWQKDRGNRELYILYRQLLLTGIPGAGKGLEEGEDDQGRETHEEGT